ncbi:MAG: anti-sigma regulatory factor [Planctomycetota bacterium]
MQAVQHTGRFCDALGFDQGRRQMVSTAVSELAHNILKYAAHGSITIRGIDRDGAPGDAGLEVVVEDQGPGIPNVEQALEDHFSSSGTLGLGLPGVKRLMDDFHIASEPGCGTTVTVRTWV